MVRSDYVKVRDVLGNEVFRNKRTGKEYLVTWTKKGKPKLKYIGTKKKGGR